MNTNLKCLLLRSAPKAIVCILHLGVLWSLYQGAVQCVRDKSVGYLVPCICLIASLAITFIPSPEKFFRKCAGGVLGGLIGTGITFALMAATGGYGGLFAAILGFIYLSPVAVLIGLIAATLTGRGNENMPASRRKRYMLAGSGITVIVTGLIVVSSSRGDNIEGSDRCKRTAIHFAVENRNPEVVAELVRSGANTGTQDQDGKTPLQKARSGEWKKDEWDCIRQALASEQGQK